MLTTVKWQIKLYTCDNLWTMITEKTVASLLEKKEKTNFIVKNWSTD